MLTTLGRGLVGTHEAACDCGGSNADADALARSLATVREGGDAEEASEVREGPADEEEARCSDAALPLALQVLLLATTTLVLHGRL